MELQNALNEGPRLASMRRCGRIMSIGMMAGETSPQIIARFLLGQEGDCFTTDVLMHDLTRLSVRLKIKSIRLARNPECFVHDMEEVL